MVGVVLEFLSNLNHALARTYHQLQISNANHVFSLTSSIAVAVSSHLCRNIFTSQPRSHTLPTSLTGEQYFALPTTPRARRYHETDHSVPFCSEFRARSPLKQTLLHEHHVGYPHPRRPRCPRKERARSHFHKPPFSAEQLFLGLLGVLQMEGAG